MIVFVTTRHHDYTVRQLIRDGARFGMPAIRLLDYEAFWHAATLPRATYILADLERLTPHERRLAGGLRRTLLAGGARVLNDPLRFATRVPLLQRLHAAGINPFRAWRAEDAPRPGRFPVFLRIEADHGQPITGLLPDQASLDAALARLADQGVPAEGVVVVEFCAEPISPGVWQKYGTFRIGPNLSTDHAVIEDQWCVKYGKVGVATDAMVADEHAAVRDNRYAAELARAFEVAGVEWGRADHATAEGCVVVYEINTNPSIARITPQRLALRDETLLLARGRMAAQLSAIDTPEGGEIVIEPGPLLEKWRSHSAGAAMGYRP